MCCRSTFGLWTVLLSFLSLVSQIAAAPAPAETLWIPYTEADGTTVLLSDDRQPALYTQNYGDCQGDSLVTLTRYDASFYKDNMTVLFHFAGSTPLLDESTMIYIGVYAYGESRFNLTFNPCFSNIMSMCPLNSSVPIEAAGIIPLTPAEVAAFPNIALTIPDFEGQAIIRIFSNTTQSQIACYSAALSNGASFSHPAAVGSTVGIFVIIALISSVAVAVYGQSVPEARIHYAHSLSMFVVFSVLQHVFYTGALSMNFPSVLVAFWSNFAWAAGMIHSKSMQNSINAFIGNHRGNISMFGSLASGQSAQNLGGGYSISQIYKRDLINSSTGFSWYGDLVEPGLPLPGNFSGFAGTLGELDIPASNAFLTGFLWLLILIALLIGNGIVLKLSLEALAKLKMLKTDRLGFFRTHWIYFVGIIILRTLYVAFFMMMFLTMFQFTFGGGPGVLAIAAVVFALFFVGMFGVAAYALWYRLRSEEFHKEADRLQFKSKPGRLRSRHGFTRKSTAESNEDTSPPIFSFPWIRMYFSDPAQRNHVHEDEPYLFRFGWLFARFRRSKWWFFSLWLVYEFVRACFYGGAAGHPQIQVFGLLGWEILSLITIIIMKPFESNRLNLLMVYLLGFSKVVTVALTSAFDPRFGLNRILTTAIGIIIIVIQGILIVCLLITIILGAISSYMSVRRYHEDIKPKSLEKPRVKYFAHIEQKAADKVVKPPPKPVTPVSEEPKEPYFAVTAVRRELKIEDEDPENENNLPDDDVATAVEVGKSASRAGSRPGSIRSNMSNLPYGAKRHRNSWNTQDLQKFNIDDFASGRNSRMSMMSTDSNLGESATRPASRSGIWADSASLADAAQGPSVNGIQNSPPRGQSHRSRHRRSGSGFNSRPQSGNYSRPQSGNWSEHGDDVIQSVISENEQNKTITEHES